MKVINDSPNTLWVYLAIFVAAVAIAFWHGQYRDPMPEVIAAQEGLK